LDILDCPYYILYFLEDQCRQELGFKKKREAKEKHDKGNQHGRNKRRRKTVTSSLNEMSTFQLGNRVVVREAWLLRTHPPLSTAEPEFLIFLRSPGIVSKSSIPPT
jgi:hypothetical protein